MKIIENSIEMIYPRTSEEWIKEARLIELAARTCYKSEDKITHNSWEKMVKMLKEKEHGAMIEFGNFICKIITDRGVTHELVRHRLASYAQESTRYCNYGKDKFNNEITVIKPSEVLGYEGSAAENNWKYAMEKAEAAYLKLLDEQCTPQQARAVLPNSLKTEIVMKTNFRELLHILKLRLSKAAHPDIRSVMEKIYDVCHENLPQIFTLNFERLKT